MGLQARLSKDDTRLYDANRDIAHNFPLVLQDVIMRLEKEVWPSANAVLKAIKCPEAELGKAANAFATFVVTSVDSPKETMLDALQRSGWFAVHPAAQVVVMAYLGQVMTGMFFHGAREATIGGVGPLSSVEQLVAAGRYISRLMAYPRWLRPLIFRWLRLKEAYAASRKQIASERKS
jgi:hypothetical protein